MMKDKAKIKDELSDIMWYIAIASEGLGENLDDIMQHNIDKLKARYPNGFEVEKSLNRGDSNDRPK